MPLDLLQHPSLTTFVSDMEKRGWALLRDTSDGALFQSRDVPAAEVHVALLYGEDSKPKSILFQAPPLESVCVPLTYGEKAVAIFCETLAPALIRRVDADPAFSALGFLLSRGELKAGHTAHRDWPNDLHAYCQRAFNDAKPGHTHAIHFFGSEKAMLNLAHALSLAGYGPEGSERPLLELIAKLEAHLRSFMECDGRDEAEDMLQELRNRVSPPKPRDPESEETYEERNGEGQPSDGSAQCQAGGS